MQSGSEGPLPVQHDTSLQLKPDRKDDNMRKHAISLLLQHSSRRPTHPAASTVQNTLRLASRYKPTMHDLAFLCCCSARHETQLDEELDLVLPEHGVMHGKLRPLKEGQELTVPLDQPAAAGKGAQLMHVQQKDEEDDMTTMKRRAQVRGSVLCWLRVGLAAGQPVHGGSTVAEAGALETRQSACCSMCAQRKDGQQQLLLSWLCNGSLFGRVTGPLWVHCRKMARHPCPC